MSSWQEYYPLLLVAVLGLIGGVIGFIAAFHERREHARKKLEASLVRHQADPNLQKTA
jgi:hypothetical protein